ncbi:PREDICTED: probable inactive shikimate kinase like 1, chloroplastic isoform X2 [Lupinus angustifolius]|uniref:probable inactive shikimate kinase like 1, chloroplastic isoform X2 n=1 Tax=Lupinus angustifolius TaxID=3871 RepID=UPI00092FC2AA|nr:PREDICTED: probable inactive shikimate kinase like 1, chloroplastic isoform X2 [Lupinus angustifolius]
MEKAIIPRLKQMNFTISSLQLHHFPPSTFAFPTHHPFRNRPLSTNSSLPPDATTIPTSVTKVDVADDSSLAVKVLIQKKAADVSPELKGTSIFLIGLGSSLKTNLGKLLAEVLRYYYFDSDSLVEEALGGASAAKSVRESDEKGFFESETEVLKQLSSMGRLVVCAGNGAVQSSTNLALLRHGISLLVDVPLDIVARDVIEDRGQFASFEISTPGSYPDVTNQLAALYNKHKDGYATSDAVISLQKVASRLGYDNLNDITKEDMALEALGEIEKLTRVKKMMAEAARPF